MHLIVGLGNPGKEYENTRHNIGFMMADNIARYYEFGAPKLKFSSQISYQTVDNVKIYLQKPLTYMNCSGSAVRMAANFLKIPIENIIVIHDDLDIAIGKFKVKIGGGSGGHNGLKDIDASLGREYKRIRIGIGHPGCKDLVTDYVLHKFKADEQQEIDRIIDELTKNIHQFIN